MIIIEKSINEIIKTEILHDKKLNKFYEKKYPNSKYTLNEIIKTIIFKLQTGLSWKKIPNGTTYFFHFSRIKFIFGNIYKKMLSKYLCYDTKTKLKYISTDTTFIKNNYGINKVERNKYFKNKKCSKISTIVDINGIPLSLFLFPGNENDMILLKPLFKHFKCNKNIILNNTKYFSADKGYDSNNIRGFLKTKNIDTMIPINRRNTKNTIKLEENKLTKSEIKIYKKKDYNRKLF